MTKDTQAIQTFLNKSNDDATNKAESEEKKGQEEEYPLKDQKEKEEEKVDTVDTMLFPNHGWFLKWKDTLHLGNIKVACQHTYNKAMAFRN